MPIATFLKRCISKRKPVPLDAGEMERAAELRDSVAALPPLDGATPSSPAAADWLGNRRRLRELLIKGDPRRFLEWDVIHKTMFLGNAGYIPVELGQLKSSKQWNSRWKRVLNEDPAGCPSRCRWRLGSSGNLIHHTYHVYRSESFLGREINQFPSIIEFGGGYGSFCRLAWRLGFRGRYVIFDLPEFSLLQQYFLRSVGVPIAENGESSGARLITQLDDLRAEAHGDGLFVGCWSISETPLDFRRQVLDAVSGMDNYLIGYQDQFAEIDNVRFFSEWSAGRSQSQWHESRIEHMPGSRYLFGRKM